MSGIERDAIEVTSAGDVERTKDHARRSANKHSKRHAEYLEQGMMPPWIIDV